MRRKKLMQLENILVLSIQYARLKEEISDTESVLTEIKSKAQASPINVVAKAGARIDKVKVAHSQDYIRSIKKSIEEIECKYSKKEYGIYQTSKFIEILYLLQKQNNSEIIKYQIAIRTVLDNTCAYKNTDDFLELLSETLFNDKEIIVKIKKKMIEIIDCLSDTKEVDLKIIDKVQMLAKMPVATKVAARVPFFKKINPLLNKKLLKTSASAIIISTATMGAEKGIKRLMHKRNIKKIIRNLDVDDFEFILYANALFIWYAKQLMTELKLQNYVSKQLKLLNSLRTKINYELFEKMYNVQENYKKILLLSNFDRFLIENRIVYSKE